MINKNNLLRSFVDALGVFAYILILAWFFFNGEGIFGNGKSFLIPVFMLLLFIISALITGLLVLGKPVLLYLHDSKKEAFVLLFETLGWLILFLFLVVIILVL